MAETATSAELTIDELARRTGMTVRNIRAHQSRGLLPAPKVRGRTGFYGNEHESRINLIRELQADGFKLEAVGRLLDSAGGSSEEVLRFTRAVKAPFEDEQPQIVSAEELAGRWGGDAPRPELIRRAEAALDVAGVIRKHSDAVAKAFAALFIDQIWKPFEREGRPEGDLPEVRDALERLRPLASDALLAMFQLVMTEVVEDRMGRELERIQERKNGGRGPRQLGPAGGEGAAPRPHPR